MKKTANLMLKGLGIVAFLLVGFALERYFHLSTFLDPGRMEERLQAAGPFGPLLFMLVMAVTVPSPLPTFPLDVLAGRLFGPPLGTLYAVTGATVGAMASFQLARWLGSALIAPVLKGHVNFCQQCSDKLLTKVVFLTRLVPAVSFDLVSYGSGLTRMSLAKFGIASFLGMLPLTFVYTSFGPLLSVSTPVLWIGGAAFLALMFVVPRWIEKHDFLGMSRFFVHESDSAEGPAKVD